MKPGGARSRLRRLCRGLTRACLLALLAVLIGLGACRWQASRRERDVARTAAPPGGRFIQAADVVLYVQEAGDPEAPAVLFVHGTGAWSETWRGALTAAAAAGYHAVAIDLPPFGYSQRPADGRYGKRDQGRRIAAALDGLGLPQAVLVGHSFGGGPTVEAALQVPGRVRALVLVDAALGVGSSAAPPPAPSPLLRGALALQPLRDSVVAAFFSNPRFTRRLLLSFIADPAAATPERVAVYQRPLSVEGTTRAFGQWLPALLAPAEAARSEDPAAYAGLTMPVVLIWGDRDTITPLAQGQRLATLCPRAELAVLAGVGHIPQIESPARFEQALVKALSRSALAD
jgi:pimeloyl-ACP methyl ester carboxylesterase